MPDDVKLKNEEKSTPLWQRIPVAGIIWALLTVLVFFVGNQMVTLQDQQRFPDDFTLVTQENEAENSVDVEIVSGTFRYQENPNIPTPVETGTFTPDDDAPVANRLFEALPDATEIVIEAQTIRITYESDNEALDAEAFLRQARRPMNNAIINDRETITGEAASDAENTVVFTTTDETFEYGQYEASLIEAGTTQEYASREEGEAGSEMAQFLFANVRAMEGLIIRPDGMTIQYREGAVENQVVTRVEEALDDFHPRASLQPHLWLMTLSLSSEKIIDVVPLDTGLPLIVFTLGFMVIELLLFYVFWNSEDKLIRPLVRVLGVFFFFWSIYGHEPLWDYILSLIFPTSPQLVHPNATVIEFTAQHLELVFVSSLITIPMGLFIGIIVTRDDFREILPLANNLVNSGQTVPTIAVVAFMAPLIGFGFWPAIIALVLYGLLPVVRNTIAGLESVSDFIIDSARGMGMTPTQILLQIELPIASSIIMAGIRTSMVINVGTATLGAFVGSGGLGTPIASGLAMTVDPFILLGAIPAAILAILIDYVLGRIEFVLTPRGLQLDG